MPLTPTPALNLEAIRAEFPALASDFVYLDNAGGSQVLRRVADRIHDYLLTSPVQLGASYAASRTASARVLAARRAVAELIHAGHDDEVVMGAATTALMFQVTQAILPGVKPGDEIILTNTDHEANIGAWLRLQAAGAVVRFWNVNPDTLTLDLADLQPLLTPRVTWVAMTAASNVLGSINPVAQVAALVHHVGARLCVDAVAYAPHRLVDVEALGADLLVFSFYKIFGPHCAVLWGRRELLLSLTSLNHYFIANDDIPYKLQPGNVNFELSYGCIGISDYLVAVGESLSAGRAGAAHMSRRHSMQLAFDAFARHEDHLAEMLLAFLRGKKSVRIIGSPYAKANANADAQTAASPVAGQRVPTISFTVAGTHSESIVRQVDLHHIGIRFGDFYARRLIDALGLASSGGVVRVSMAHYNTEKEIQHLVRVLDSILK